MPALAIDDRMSRMSFLMLDPEDPRWTERGALHVPPGEGMTRWVSGDEYTIKATGAATNGAMEFIEAVVPPQGGPAAHLHTWTDEAFYVLSGALEFLDGDQTFVAEAGAFVFIPRNHRHRFKNVGSEDARTLFLFTPGPAESFFLTVGDVPVPGERPEPWGPEKFMQLGETVQEHDSYLMPEPQD
jgi:quercetin dioxygenase-like cupin family protein